MNLGRLKIYMKSANLSGKTSLLIQFTKKGKKYSQKNNKSFSFSEKKELLETLSIFVLFFICMIICFLLYIMLEDLSLQASLLMLYICFYINFWLEFYNQTFPNNKLVLTLTVGLSKPIHLL